MFIDITLELTPELIKDANNNEKKTLFGHIGTHFDCMNKEFPLDYIKREGIIFNKENEKFITLTDEELNKIKENSFVLFYTRFIEKKGYSSSSYFHSHPELETNLIQKLIKKRVSLIGLDFAGIKNGKEHTIFDQLLADNNIFVIENLCSLKKVVDLNNSFTVYTLPVKYKGLSGLPCRVVIEK